MRPTLHRQRQESRSHVYDPEQWGAPPPRPREKSSPWWRSLWVVAPVSAASGPADSAIPYCYWARLVDTSGEFDAIIANGSPQGPGVVTIEPGAGAFETSGCQPWVKQ